MRFVLRLAPLAALSVLLLAACSEDEQAPNAVTVEGSEFAFAVAEGELTPGINTIRFANGGAEDHHLQFVALDAGKTVDEFLEAFASGPPPAWASIEGGVGVVSPGREASATLHLREGTYALLCFLESESDGAPHFAKGMAATFEVAGDEVVADAPEEELTIAGRDFAFEAPESAAAGELTFRFDNLGQDLHEVSIFWFPEGTELDLKALSEYFGDPAPEGPPPLEAMPVGVGGVQGIIPGGSQLATVDLEAGTYMLVCFIPDAEGVPHVGRGMIAQLRVQ